MFSRLTTSFLATIISTTTGLSLIAASNLLLIIFIYIIVLIVGILIHRWVVRSRKKIIQSLTREYDMLRYLVAQAQKNQPNAPTHSGIKIIFDTPHPDYLHHYDIIQKEIQSIESDLQMKIVDDAARNKISVLTKKQKHLTTFTNGLWWLLSLITVFVYRLFR